MTALSEAMSVTVVRGAVMLVAVLNLAYLGAEFAMASRIRKTVLFALLQLHRRSRGMNGHVEVVFDVIRHLSPTIAIKRNLLTVFRTVL